VTLTELRAAVRTRIGVPTADSFYPDATLTDLVNEALAAVSAEADWPWLQASTTFATVAGTATYTPPADWDRTRALTIDGYDAMDYRTLPEIREYLSTIRGVPRVYTVSGEDLLLRPTPDSTYTVAHDYIVTEAPLVLDADTPLMPAQFHYSIVAFAVHLAHARNNEIGSYRGAVTGAAAAALAQYAQWLTRMHKHRRRSSGPMRVRVRAGGIL
jgi:hypothetical protein